MKFISHVILKSTIKIHSLCLSVIYKKKVLSRFIILTQLVVFLFFFLYKRIPLSTGGGGWLCFCGGAGSLRFHLFSPPFSSAGAADGGGGGGLIENKKKQY